MENKKEILKAFLEEEFRKQNIELDQATINAISSQIEFTPRPTDESEQVKSIKLKQDSSGKVTAESIKLWNITQISTEDLLKFLGKEIGILMFDDTIKKIIYAFGMLLLEYYPKLKHSFNEQDAKVIFSIAKLQKKNFTTEELNQQFKQDFEEGISEEKLEDSLDELIEWKVVKRTAAKQYALKENIKNLSRN